MSQCSRFLRLLVIIVGGVVFLPGLAMAQSINGLVKDSSGAVLPGVSVEAASPALIEKTRVVTTDANGRYEIIQLRPGDYIVTFSLQGFGSVKREGVTLTGDFTATINAELKVGTQAETITVTATAPIVDINSARRETVLNNADIQALPTSRIHSALVQLIPGLQADSQDVGGTIVAGGRVGGHGMHGNDSRILTNGLFVASQRSAGSGTSTPNVGASEEAAIDYAGVGAESQTGGIQVNLVPKEGGNSLRSSSYLNYANEKWQSNNITSDLTARQVGPIGGIKHNWDLNPGFGGPIKRDKVWFYFSSRAITADNYAGGLFLNKNAGNPNALTFEPTTQKAVNFHDWKDNQLRLSWQVSPRNKLGGTIEEMRQCECPSGASATTTVEASASSKQAQKHQYLFDYTLPLTNKILLEAHTFYREDDWSTENSNGNQDPTIQPINIQSTNFNYAAQRSFNDSHSKNWYSRAAMAYVTGSHNIKVGFSTEFSFLTQGTNVLNPVYIRVSAPLQSGGVPNQLTLNALPNYPYIDITPNLGVYAQDKWTLRRLTLAVGARYDNFKGSYRDETFGPTPLAPNRNITFKAGTTVHWQDITPRLALTYDVFGTGKTAFKTTLNKYMGAEAASGLAGTLNPFFGLVTSTTRTWTPPKPFVYNGGPLVPNCDLTNPLPNGGASGTECGIDANTAFGTNVGGQVVDPKLSTGWGHRDYSWEFSTGVQRQLLTGLSAEVSYFRRWYGNFNVTDNLALNASDFTQFSVPIPTGAVFSTAPAGATIPNAGGTIDGLYTINPNKNGVPANNFQTLASNYGKQTEHWNGVDLHLSARMPIGLTLQGGSSTGRYTTNTCAIRAALPETAPLNPFCDVSTGWQTDFTGYATYTIPKVDVLASITWQNHPSRQIGAQIGGGGGTNGVLNYGLQNNQIFPCGPGTAIAAQLGFNCTNSGNNVTVPLVKPYSVGAPRFSEIDVRIGKVVRIAKTRTVINFDAYNLLNSNAILSSSTNFAVWQQPTSILQSRFVKVGMEFDF